MTKDLSQTSKSSFKTKITCTKSWKSDHKITFLMKLSKNVPLFTTWIKRISPPVLKYLWEQDGKTDLLSLALPVQPGCLTHTLSSFGLTSSVIHFYLHPKHTSRYIYEEAMDWLSIPIKPATGSQHIQQCLANVLACTGVHNVLAEIKGKLDKGIVSSTFLLEWPWNPSVQAPRVLSLRYHLTDLPQHQCPQILDQPMDLRYCLTFQFLLNPGWVSPLRLWLSTHTGPHSRYVIWIQPAISTTSYQRWKQPISRWPLWSWFPVLYFPRPIFLVWNMWLEQFCTCYFSVSYNFVCQQCLLRMYPFIQ